MSNELETKLLRGPRDALFGRRATAQGHPKGAKCRRCLPSGC